MYPIAVSRPLSSSFVLTQRLPKEERGREAGRGRKEGNGLVELMVTEVVLVIAREVVLLVARVGGAIDGGIGVGGGEIVAHLCLLVMNGDGKEAAVMGCSVLCCGGEYCRLGEGDYLSCGYDVLYRNAVGSCNGLRRIV